MTKHDLHCEGRKGFECKCATRTPEEGSDQRLVRLAGTLSVSRSDLKAVCDAVIADHEMYDEDSGSVHCEHCDGTGSRGWTDKSKNRPLKHGTHCPVLIAQDIMPNSAVIPCDMEISPKS